jgi:2-hydroxychromene-2-carboxylate isomerase
MKTLDWYFDFVSPFAYLQNAVLGRIAAQVEIRRRPILFAGLLGHWGQLGPAEIPPKRAWTFRHCAWLAERHGIPLAMPAMHPFNPLPLLRLATALDASAAVVDRLFAFVWQEGRLPTDRVAWDALLAELGVDEAATQTSIVKDALRAAGQDAIAAGCFGVPSAIVDDQVFWGFDSTDMLLAYLEGAPFFGGRALAAVDAMPSGPMRPQLARAAT